MKTAVIYGSTGTGRKVYDQIKEKYQVQYFVDEDEKRVGKDNFGISIDSRKRILREKPDIVVMGQLTGYQEAAEWLIENGYPEEHIVLEYVDLPFRARKSCLISIAEIFEEKKTEGAVAELGVYRGDFAKVINEIFPKRKLYLFDTFEGFPEEDVKYEVEHHLLTNEIGMLSNTSVEYVLNKMPYKDQVIIRQGYFPETAEGLDESFAFVNIDVDLYKPILAGLEYFWPRMVKGGYIFVHDYFSNAYTGSRKAVEEFAQKTGIGFVPIGDTLSVAFVKE